MHRLDAAIFNRISAAVEEQAKKYGESGIFAMVDFATHVIMWAAINRESGLRISVKGKDDANFTAVVLTKIAMVIEHRKNTGPSTIKGEVPYLGGRISEDKEFGYAFSGAPQEIDDVFAQVAEEAHAEL